MSQEGEPFHKGLELPVSIASEEVSEYTPFPLPRAEKLPIFDFDKDWLDRCEIDEEELRELLTKAKAHVFSMGVGDAASQIGEVVSQFFVAKMFYVQKKLGLPLYTSVIQPPDATIQTYHTKFMRSVPETAKIIWGRKDETEFIPAEIDVDFCGMIAVGFGSPLSALELAENITKMKKNLKILDQWPLDTNCIQPGNHFANIYKVPDHERFNLPPFVGVAHLASDEFRNLMRGFVEKLGQKITTPFGDSLVLIGEAAKTYWEIAQEGSYFAREKRKMIAQEIFKSDHILSNDTHYELISPSACLIGCNGIESEDDYHVIVTKSTHDAYLVKGKKGLSPLVIQRKGVHFSSPIFEELTQANILPHGSGHSLVEDRCLKMALFSKEGILFVTELQNGGERIVRNYHDIPRTPRKIL